MQAIGTFNRGMGRFVWRDAAGLHEAEWLPGDGNVKIDGIEADQVEAIPLTTRGVFAEMVPGDYKPVTVTIDIRHCGPVTHATETTAFDAINQSGAYDSDTTADPGGLCWTGDAVYSVTRGGVTTGWRFYNGRVTASYGEAKEANSFSMSIVFHGRPASSLLPIVAF